MKAMKFPGAVLAVLFAVALAAPASGGASNLVINSGSGNSFDGNSLGVTPHRQTISGSTSLSSSYSNQVLTMAASATLSMLPGVLDGQFIRIEVCENGTGGYTPTWAAGSGVGAIRWSGGSAPTPTTTANFGDVYAFSWNASATTWTESGLVSAVACP
jgi:hypothetical protein